MGKRVKKNQKTFWIIFLIIVALILIYFYNNPINFIKINNKELTLAEVVDNIEQYKNKEVTFIATNNYELISGKYDLLSSRKDGSTVKIDYDYKREIKVWECKVAEVTGIIRVRGYESGLESANNPQYYLEISEFICLGN